MLQNTESIALHDKFAKFVYICIMRRKAYHFPANFGSNV